MRNISGRFAEKLKNTHITRDFNNYFFSKIVPFII